MAHPNHAEEYALSQFSLDISKTSILFCGHQYCAPKHAYGPGIRTYYLMVYIHNGRGTFKTQNMVYHLQKGCTFCVFPGEVIYYQADETDPWEYSWIAFNGEIGMYDISQILLKASITPHHPIHTTENYQNISSQFYHIVELSKNKEDFTGLKTFSVFLDILYHYVKTDNCTDIQAIASPLSSHLDIAIEYIKYYYHKNISVSEIAQHLGIRREYFCSLFKRQFGISPVQFIRSYRLKVSSTLLISSKKSIEEIAYEVGYNDYNYYSNSFHRLYGISPTRYRKLAINGQPLPDPFDALLCEE